MPSEENKERIPIKSLRTYQGDVDEAIGKNKESSASIFIAEQKRKIENPKKVAVIKDHPVRNKIYMYFGGIFFILGVCAIASVYYIRSNENTVVEQSTKTLLAFSKEKNINIASSTRENVLSAIKQERDTFNLPINSVLYINTMSGNSKAKAENVLSFIGPNQPGSLSRAFDGDYMLGVYSYDTNEVFLILKTKDFASSYSGMLKWEKNMPADLQKIFNLAPELLSSNMSFSDDAVKNKDLRVLKDYSGKTQLLYSFIDKETLVITKNESVFGAILGRLSISRQSK